MSLAAELHAAQSALRAKDRELLASCLRGLADRERTTPTEITFHRGAATLLTQISAECGKGVHRRRVPLGLGSAVVSALGFAAMFFFDAGRVLGADSIAWTLRSTFGIGILLSILHMIQQEFEHRGWLEVREALKQVADAGGSHWEPRFKELLLLEKRALQRLQEE